MRRESLHQILRTVLRVRAIEVEQLLARTSDVDALNSCRRLPLGWLPERLWATGHRMTDAEIDDKLPRAVRLFFPESDEVAVHCGLFSLNVLFELPGSSGETEISGSGHARESRLPREQRVFVGRRRGIDRKSTRLNS